MKLHFVGIGASKAGTTQVAEVLGTHPELCLSEPKEVHYFNKIQSYIHGEDNPHYEKPLAWYAKHFAHCAVDAKRGEFSTGYLYDPDAAERIAAKFPDAKIIACLREPVSRAYSHFTMHRYYLQKENRSFEDTIHTQMEYLEKGLYYKQLLPYFERFPKEQIMIILLDDWIKDASAVCRKLYSFLEIDTEFESPKLLKKANSAKASRFKFVSEWMGHVSHFLINNGMSSVVAGLKKLGLRDLLINLNSKKLDYPPLDKEMKDKLRPFFHEDIAALEQLIGRDLTAWKGQRKQIPQDS